MTDQQGTETAPSATEKQKRTREIGTIGFTYGDLDDAVEVATALLGRGGVPCEPDQVAVAMKQTPSSGSFRGKIATAKMFGLIETVQNKYTLTTLGFAITDATRQKAARADAFLNVPLFRKLYDTFRNQQLPPRPLALGRTLIQMGVPEKQADRARSAFDNSAQQAGYFDHGGRDRLIRPPVGSTAAIPNSVVASETVDDPPPPDPKTKKGGGRNGGGEGEGDGDSEDYHPFVQGLLDTLPAPGTLWTIEGRAAWLEAAASTFKLIYKGDGKITIGVAADNNRQNGGQP
jgi:hypothetical protein